MKRRFFLSATAAAPVVASAPAVAVPMVEMSAADIAPVVQVARSYTWYNGYATITPVEFNNMLMKRMLDKGLATRQSGITDLMYGDGQPRSRDGLMALLSDKEIDELDDYDEEWTPSF